MSDREGPDLSARFCVSLSLTISKQEDKGDRTPRPTFSETSQVYFDLKYPETLKVQQAISDALLGLGYEALKS